MSKYKVQLTTPNTKIDLKDLKKSIEHFLSSRVSELEFVIDEATRRITATFKLLQGSALTLAGQLKDWLGYPHSPSIAPITS